MQSRTKVIVDLAGLSGELKLTTPDHWIDLSSTHQINVYLFAVPLEPWRQLMHRHSARISLCLSSSLLIVRMHSTILVAMAVYHPRLLSMLNTMGVLTPKRHIHTQQRMGNVNS